MTKRLILGVLAAVLLSFPGAAQAEFGIVPGSVTIAALNKDGTINSQAGSHPYEFTVGMKLNTNEAGEVEGGLLRNLIFDLPRGWVGNPRAVPVCSRKSFEGFRPECPAASQIGVLYASLIGTGDAYGPIYNLAPEPGAAAQVGFSVAALISTPSASVRSESGYSVRVSALNAPIGTKLVKAVLWGVPADPSHDAERGLGEGEPSGETPRAFLTLPTACGEPLKLTATVDSRLEPGHYVSATGEAVGAGGAPVPLTGCSGVPFAPGVVASPSTQAAESPSGLGYQLNLPNAGLLSPGANAETEPTKMVVKLPAGFTSNPAAATGLEACSEEEIGFKEVNAVGPVFNESPDACPSASKLGSFTASTPLLDEGLEGSVYLATPHQNPYGTLLSLYIVAEAPERGVLIKQAVRVDLDGSSGQLTATTEGMPPLPYSGFQLHLRDGARAPLITPQVCGSSNLVASLYPFSDPDRATVKTVPFKVTSGNAGSACASSEADLPNAPSLSAGSSVATAGAYSPFVLKMTRDDGSQRFSAISAEPPLGLTARLAGIPYCPEGGIGQAQARTGQGDGGLEIASPSCPAASQIGTVVAGAGAGSAPFITGGNVYLAGPYKGAPLSFVAIAPAVAGPFDLGVVSDRIAVFVNEETAKIAAIGDPLPQMLHGIPLDLRSVEVRIDRPSFTLNPTNCEPTAVAGSLVSAAGSLASLAQRFQVGGCGDLAFNPKLSIQLKGATKRSGHPSLKAVVTFAHRQQEANAKSIQVGLPHSLFLDQSNLDKVCTQANLKASSCPPGSIYGHVKAWTPLFDQPLQGPVYLGVGFGYKLPALVTDLNGQVRILAHGRVDTTKQSGLRNTFEFVPDAPLSRIILQMKGGKKYGLIENSENLCSKTQRASARFTAHSGAVAKLHPKLRVSCGRKGQGRKK